MAKPQVTPEEPETRVPFSLRADKPYADRVAALAAAENRTPSTMTRILLAEAVAARAAGTTPPEITLDRSQTRPVVSTYVSTAGRDAIKSMARAEMRTTSDMAGILLAEAVEARTTAKRSTRRGR